jgi:hypothetical protein
MYFLLFDIQNFWIKENTNGWPEGTTVGYKREQLIRYKDTVD